MPGQSHRSHSGTSLMPQGLPQGRLDTPTSQLSILQVVSVSHYIKVLVPMGKQSAGAFSDIRVTMSSPREPILSSDQEPVSLLPAPASFFDGPYISLLGVPQLNIQTRRFKPRTFIFSQFRRLEVQGRGTGRFIFFCGLSPWPAQGHFSLCLTRSFFRVRTSLVFAYVSTYFLLIETPVTLSSPPNNLI